MTDAPSELANTDGVHLCLVCKKAIPSEALKCTECGSFQNWRRIFPFSTEILALLIALFSVLGITIPELTKWKNRHSHTQVRIVGASEEALLVIVMNTGREPSTARVFHASFLNVPLADVDLIPENPGELHVPAGDSHIVRLRPRGFPRKPGSDVAAVTNALRGGTLKLIAGIQESTDEGPTDMQHVSDEYPTTNLSSWITSNILR